MNRGAGDGLKITVEQRFFEDKRAVTWVKMQTEKIENNVNDKVNRCMKWLIFFLTNTFPLDKNLNCCLVPAIYR